MALAIKNLSDDAGDLRDAGSIPGSGRALGEDTATHSGILAWRTPWRVEPGGIWPIGSQSQTPLT